MPVMAKAPNASRNHEDRSDDRPFPFLRMNRRPPKPRTRGLTEIRGPYYAPIGRRLLEDILECWSVCIDSFKFGGGSFALLPTPHHETQLLAASLYSRSLPFGTRSKTRVKRLRYHCPHNRRRSPR